VADKNKKSFDMILGKRGSFDPDPVTEIIRQNRAEAERKRLERQDRLDELKAQAEEKELQGQLSEEDKKKMKELEDKNQKLQEAVQKGEIDRVRVELGGMINQLKESIESGASKKTISEQFAEIKQVAADIGLGGSKISEQFQEAVALVDKIRPSKGLAEQVKEAKELLEPFKEKTGELPAEISLKIREMDRDLQLRLEEMKDERAQRDREWQLQVKKWEEEREDKKALTEAEISAKKDGNVLLADGVQKIAELITAIKPGVAGGVAGKAVNPPVIEAGLDESGEVECVNCHNAIPISADSSSSVTCPLCGTSYPIKRIPKMKEATSPKAEAPV